jgi:OPT oligopeptide transporter protein
MIGYGFAGLCRRFLVYPADMIWPSVLQTSTFLNTMHRDRNPPAGRWTISRYRLFFVSMACMFAYCFLPTLVPFVSKMNILPMIWPESKIVNTLFGMKNGLCLLPLTLSYQTAIAFLGTCICLRRSHCNAGPPQVVPFSAHVNIFFGVAFWFWLVAGIMYAMNHWNSQYFPIASYQQNPSPELI